MRAVDSTASEMLGSCLDSEMHLIDFSQTLKAMLILGSEFQHPRG